MGVFTNFFSPASKAVEQLVEQYEQRLHQVEPLGEGTVRGRLTDGAVVIAMLLGNGQVKVWELEGAA